MSAVDLYRSGPITNPRPVRERLEYPNFGDISGGGILVYFGYVPENNPLSSGSYGDGSIYTHDSLDIIEKIEMQQLSTVESSPYAFSDIRLTHVIPDNYGQGYQAIVHLPDEEDNYTVVMDPRLYTFFYYPEVDAFVLYMGMKPIELAYDSSGMPTKMPKITCYKYISLVGIENFIPPGVGAQGFQGFQGPQGFQGFQGNDGTFIVADTPPPNPTPGTTWFNCVSGREFIWYDNYWVESGTSWATVGAQGVQGFQGVQGEDGMIIVSDVAPPSPIQGTTWFDCASGKEFIWYDNYWVEFGTSWATQGTQGLQGQTGLQGIQGFQGLQGSGANIIGFIASQNTAAPNNLVNASRLLVDSATTDADAVIQPKGVGAILAQLPDNTVTGGNKRGAYAVDFQVNRTAAAEVASGQYAFQVGRANRTTNSYGFTAGQFNRNTGNQTFMVGDLNSDEAWGSSFGAVFGQNHALNGNSNGAAGSFQYAFGRGANISDDYTMAFAKYGAFTAGQRDFQQATTLLNTTTTNATPTTVASNSGQNLWYPNRVIGIEAIVVAKRSDVANTEGSVWNIRAAAMNGAILPGAIIENIGTTTVPWTVALTNNSGFIITGETGKTIRWGIVLKRTVVF